MSNVEDLDYARSELKSLRDELDFLTQWAMEDNGVIDPYEQAEIDPVLDEIRAVEAWIAGLETDDEGGLGQRVGGQIKKCVGKGGNNDSHDVCVIQHLLVMAGANLGTSGPNGDGVDGDCGSKTKAAISSFQQSEFGWQDGLVEPDGQTWGALAGLAPPSAFDPGATDDVEVVDPTNTPPSTDPPNKGETCEVDLEEVQAAAVDSAVEEWEEGVCEENEEDQKNRGEVVDEYNVNAGVGKGQKWCGAFVGFVLEEAGFKHATNVASRLKARQYFLYRKNGAKTGSAENDELDELREDHEAAGIDRKFFILSDSDSDTAELVQTKGPNGTKRFGHFDVDANTFDYGDLPIRRGDVALFNRGHVGIVESYDPATGELRTIEGNASGERADGTTASADAVVKNTYDLSNRADRTQFDGFGRPSAADFEC